MRVAYGGEVLQVPEGWRLAEVGADGRTVLLEREAALSRPPKGLLALPAPTPAPKKREKLEEQIIELLREMGGKPITSQRMCIRFLGVKAPSKKVRYLKLLLQQMDEQGAIRILPPEGERKRTTYAIAG